MRLEGKVALISGAARGMGNAEARLFAAEGAKVAVCDVRDDEGKALAEEIGADARYLHLDVTNEDEWASAVAATTEAFGRLDVLVNNAGIAEGAPLEEMDARELPARHRGEPDRRLPRHACRGARR